MQRPFLVLSVLVALVVGWYFYSEATARFEPLTPESAFRIRDAIVEKAHNYGGEWVFHMFRSSYGTSSPEIQHSAAHLLGEALYLAEGVQGVSVCTGEFNFGCYHGFFSKAIVQEGLDLVTELDAVCMNAERPTACQHGIGHGILEYVGVSKLEEALALCGRTSQFNPIAGCTSGVFMEYNGPLVVTEGQYTIEPRPLEDASHPYAPCDTISSQYRESCYHELPQWWKQVYEGGFAQMGQFCAALTDPVQVHACISGIGGIVAPSVQYDVTEVIAACDLMSTEPYKAECLQYAAWATNGNVGDREGAVRICQMLPVSRQSFCLESL